MTERQTLPQHNGTFDVLFWKPGCRFQLSWPTA